MPDIKFKFDAEKFTQVACYVTSRHPDGMTRKKLFKLIYLADREHLFRYARPVIKDHYVNMDQGPVPSKAYDLVKNNTSRCSPQDLEMFSRHIRVNGMHLSVSEQASTDLLSATDKEVLDEVLLKYGHRSADYLSALSHRHNAWIASVRNRPIGYDLFFDTEGKQSMRQLVERNQRVRDLVSQCPAVK
jgi:uncharacterized phage-associated protein